MKILDNHNWKNLELNKVILQLLQFFLISRSIKFRLMYIYEIFRMIFLIYQFVSEPGNDRNEKFYYIPKE